MFHPVGPHRPSVYWRRRLVFLLSVVLVLVLLILVIRAVTSSAAPAAAGTSSSHPPSPRRHTSAPAGTPTKTPSSSVPSASAAASSMAASSAAASSAAAASAAAMNTASSSGTATGSAASASVSTTAPPQPCTAGALRIAAVPAAPHYAVGSKPVLGMQVTNVGAAPCVQDLADNQVLLRIYNGEARVWGSHDCAPQPGTDLRILPVGTPVRVNITWSATTSQPKCAGPRQSVGAGTYTLYVSLSGHTGTAATFTMS